MLCGLSHAPFVTNAARVVKVPSPKGRIDPFTR
jgi:hypothetical protein